MTSKHLYSLQYVILVIAFLKKAETMDLSTLFNSQMRTALWQVCRMCNVGHVDHAGQIGNLFASRQNIVANNLVVVGDARLTSL